MNITGSKERYLKAECDTGTYCMSEIIDVLRFC